MLYRICAGLLLLAALGHTFGGMLGTVRRGSGGNAEADRVFEQMKSVHFPWRGNDSTWYGFWLGNGLGVSALLVAPIVALWVLAGLDQTTRQAAQPIAWGVAVSMALTSALGFKYFGRAPGIGFGVVAILVAIATVVAT